MGKEAATISPTGMEIGPVGERDTGVMRDQETMATETKGPLPLVGGMAEGEVVGELELQISCNSLFLIMHIL